MLDFMELCLRKRGCDIFFYFMSKSIVWSWNEIWLKWKPNQPMNFTAIIYPLSTQYYPMCDAFQKWHSDDIFFSNFWSKIGFQLFKILFSNSWLKIGTFLVHFELQFWYILKIFRRLQNFARTKHIRVYSFDEQSIRTPLEQVMSKQKCSSKPFKFV